MTCSEIAQFAKEKLEQKETKEKLDAAINESKRGALIGLVFNKQKEETKRKKTMLFPQLRDPLTVKKDGDRLKELKELLQSSKEAEKNYTDYKDAEKNLINNTADPANEDEVKRCKRRVRKCKKQNSKG